ncbi:M20/M25/M40 family metallo-hydrolase [Sphingomonas sp.]|uniref:M20/M25/M40 family metallo-hydrolase n=1 Tax=Sphingomonas sp. TaxID=28214 RepID=UPI002EDA7302
MVRRFAAVSMMVFAGLPLQAQTPPAAPAKPLSVAAINARLYAPLPDDQAALKAHVLFLASDAMRGREAGSPEYDIAAQYVAAQFHAAGLKPAGDEGGYLQQVPLVTYTAAGEGEFVWTRRKGSGERLVFGQDYVPAGNPTRAAQSIAAPVVFVGYGIRAPQYGQDDYRGVDVRGKIVAYLGGAPTRFGGEERAFFGSPRTKLQTAAARGAVAVIQIASPKATPADVTRSATAYRAARVTWANADGTGHAEASIALLGTLFPAGAAKLFGGARMPWAAVVAEAAKPQPAYTATRLVGTLSAATKTAFAAARSSNVAGIIPGSDPKVGREVIVLSAHLDHIGVSSGSEGDRINNGALDDAVGIASLIEEAKRFKASGVAPKRSILFLAVTAEEKGLIGSQYFAEHPTVPLEHIVADVNLDMPILLYRFEDMVAFGAERSTLGPIVRRAAAAVGVALSPDPIPEQGIFVRSDHFRFVEKGVPSVFLWPGPANAGKAASEAFLAGCYHKPCDDVNQPILWDQGVRFVDINYRIAREIADGEERPVWNRGDYFGTLYKGRMAVK